MANATDQDRTIQNRFTGDGAKKRPYVMLVPGTRGGFEAVIVQPPDEIVFEEERPVTPSQEFRSQQVRQLAESVLSKADKGQHFKDDYLNKLQQQLRTSGGASSNALAGAVGQLRSSQRARDEARMTAAANRRQDPGTKGVQQPAEPEADSSRGIALPAPAPQKPADEEFPVVNLNPFLAGIGLVRRQAEARGLTNRFAKGEQISAEEARRAAGRLLEANRQGGVFGLEPGDSGQVIQLGEIQVSQLKKAIKDLKESDAKWRRAGRKQRAYLGQSALGMERQYQLLGVDSPGIGLEALRLADIERAQLENDIKEVLDRAKRNELSGPAYVDYLQKNLVAGERQQQLLGNGSSGRALELAMSLGNVAHMPLNQEARQVIAGLAKGQNLDDAYVDVLRQWLIEDSKRRGDRQTGELAEELREMQASRLESEVLQTLNDAKSGKRFPPFYFTYLQQRIGEMNAEDKNEEQKSRWTKLARALGDLIR